VAVNLTQKRKDLRSEREQIRTRQAEARQLAELEQKIEAMEQKKAVLETQMADGNLYRDAALARDVVQAFQALTSELDDAYAAWEKLQE